MKEYTIKIFWIILIIHNCLILHKKSIARHYNKRDTSDAGIPKQGPLEKFQLTFVEMNLPAKADFITSDCPTKTLNPYENCFEFGCVLGTKCRRPDLNNSICCPFVFNKISVTCCGESLKCKPQIKGCPPRSIPKDYNCLEMGCTLGHRCTTPTLEDRICCRHTIYNSKITCCLTEPDIDFGIEDESIELPCPPIEFPPLYHCLQIGCTIGERCKNKEMKYRRCCKHKFRDIDINCCFAVSYTSISSTQSTFCPEKQEGIYYDCLNAGCKLGTTCESVMAPNSHCCPYLIDDKIVNCCLKNKSFQFELSQTRSLFTDCPPISEIAVNFSCMEIGCAEGTLCTADGVEDHVCCPFIFHSQRISCCLLDPDQPIPACPLPPTGFTQCPFHSVPLGENCLELGCIEGTLCKSKGLEHQYCCRYRSGYVITCCLSLPKPIGFHPLLLTRTETPETETPDPELSSLWQLSSSPPRILPSPLPNLKITPSKIKPASCTILSKLSCQPCSEHYQCNKQWCCEFRCCSVT